MIDLQLERALTLTQAAKLDFLPRRRADKPINVATVFRWAQRGLRGVVLETLQIGGTKCTSREALQRFFDRLSEPSPISVPHRRTPAQREQAVQRALDELKAA